MVKSGIRLDKAISATDFRKWIVTELKRKKRLGMKIDEQLLRRLMCHSDKTANEWYLRESLTEEVAEASVLIEKHTQPAKAALPKPSKKHHEDNQMAAPQDIVCPQPSSAPSDKTGSSDKTCLSVAQRRPVDIRSGAEPRKKRVVALMRTNIVLPALTNSQPHVKRVLDRVRYLFDNRSIVDPYELPEEPAEKRTAKFVADIPEKPPSTIESGRVEWTAEETEAIQEVLTFWTKIPTNQEIQAMFKKSNVLREIFHRNTFERIRNKVKNEYRRLKK